MYIRTYRQNCALYIRYCKTYLHFDNNIDIAQKNGARETVKKKIFFLITLTLTKHHFSIIFLTVLFYKLRIMHSLFFVWRVYTACKENSIQAPKLLDFPQKYPATNST